MTQTKLRAAKSDYLPTPEEREAIDKALVARKIAPAPRLKVEESGSVSIDHPSEVIGLLLMENALGTLEPSFMTGLIEQLKTISSRGGKIDERQLNFMVSVIKGMAPRDQAESMLAAQMSVVHSILMGYAGAFSSVESGAQQDSALQAITKLARIFAGHMETLKRYRTSGEQKVTVQHVQVSDGGQAIVGDVHQHPSKRDLRTEPEPPPSLTHSKTPPIEPIGEMPRKPVRVKRS